VFDGMQEELLKRIGEKHPQYDFMMVLATKCSYLLFGREHVRAILKEISAFKSSESKDLAATSLDLLVVSTHYNSFHILYPCFAGLSVLDVYD
jgi:hypothetical protein